MIKKKICMITTSNLDYDTRVLNEIETLLRFYDLTVITPGYHRLAKIKPRFKVKVSCFKLTAKLPRDIGRMINLLALIRAVRQEEADIFHAHDLPGLLCASLALFFKKKILIYDSHELWSDVNLFGFWRILRWPFRILEKILISKVTAIITVNNSLAQILERRYGKPTLAVYNFSKISARSHNYPPLGKVRHLNKFVCPNDQKIIIYIGVFRKGRGLMQILQVAKMLDDSYLFLMIGYGRKQKEIQLGIKRLNLEKQVIIKPPVHPEELISVVKKAKVGLCLIENTSQSYYYSSPNKLFQYIAAEVPILASDFPEHRQIVLENHIGEVVNPDNPQQIAQKILEMTRPINQKKYRQNLKGLAKKKYNWALESKKFINFYHNFSTKRLKIVVDINHPAHVHFFKNFIWQMQKKGHQIFITASKKDIAFKLLENYGFNYINLGDYGKSFFHKFISVFAMDYKMLRAVKNFKPDIFLGIGSVRAAHVSKIFNKPCIIFDDSEPAALGQMLYGPFANKIYTPTCFRKDFSSKQVYYNGFHELAYLNPQYFHPDKNVLKQLRVKSNQKIFILRFVTWRAIHDIGQRGLSEKNKIYLCDFLSQYGKVIISSENDLPVAIKKRYGFSIPPEKMHDVLYFATMLVTDSQTMATEAALLGTPAIRCNSFVGPNDMGNFIELEKKYDLIYSFSSFEKALAKIEILLKNKKLKKEWQDKSRQIFKDKVDVTALMVKAVENLTKPKNIFREKYD